MPDPDSKCNVVPEVISIISCFLVLVYPFVVLGGSFNSSKHQSRLAP